MANKHTFVVLAYQESPYLEACLKSLLQQSLPSDIIVCTATPNAFIKSMAKKFDLPLKVKNQTSGIASDWNFALQQAKTDFVTLAHQDDIYLENYACEMLRGIDRNPNFLIKFSDYQEIFHSNKSTIVRTWNLNLIVKRLINLIFWPIGSSLKTSRAKINILRFGSSIPCPSVMYKLSRLKDFKFQEGLTTNLDWSAWISLAKREGSFLRSRKILLQHRIHPDSTTSLWIRNKQRYQEDLQCFSQLWPKPVARLLAKLFTLSWINNQ